MLEKRLDETEKICKQQGAKTIFLSIDITDTHQLEEAVEKCVKEFGGVNILVNAGIHLLPC